MTHRTKILGWFIVFTLITACVPSVPAPAPTLGPNAIQLYVAQTAAAAAAQTETAIPPTATFTNTPRSTFTPESTFTPIPIVTFPTSTPLQRLQYFRVKHDTQLAAYNYKSRTASDNWGGFGLQTPEVVPLFVDPKPSGGTHRTELDDTWEIYLDALNGKDKQKLRYLKANNTALFNGAGFPQLESLTMGGNVVTVVELQGSWVRVNTLDYVNPGTLKNVDYTNRPDLIQKFVIVGWNKNKKFTYWTNPPPGSIYWPLVSSRAVWISLDRLESFPALPMVVTSQVAQEIKKNPETKAPTTGKEFAIGTFERIVQYYPSGSSVWARLAGGGWILLFRYEATGPTFYTTWKMETLPPP